MGNFGSFFTEALRSVSNVATPLMLVALLGVLVLAALYLWLRYRGQVLKDLPAEQRAQAADEYLSRYKVDASSLTKDAIFQLISKEMDHKKSLVWWALMIAAVVFLLLALMATLAHVYSGPKHVAAPTDFSFVEAPRANAPMLPPDLLGGTQEHDEQPRLWMRVMDCGAAGILDLAEGEAKRQWLVTEQFEDNYHSFTAYFYAGTEKKACVAAFLVEQGNPPRVSPLRRLSGLEPKGLYLFEVPQSTRDSCLLVYLAMSKDSFAAKESCRIRSKAL